MSATRKELAWTEAEKAIVRQYFPTGGAEACRPLLPSRSKGAIATKAWLLGLEAPKKSSAARKPYAHHPTSEAMDQTIRERHAQMDGKGNGEITTLALELGVPRDWLTRRMTVLGLTLSRRKEPDWTPAEDVLFETLPLHNPKRAAQILREHGFSRTPTAIVMHARKLKIARHRGAYSAHQVAEIFGLDSKTVCQLLERGDLAGQKADDARTIQQGGSRWEVTPEALRTYVRENIERIDLRKVDKLAFFNLIDRPPAAAAQPEQMAEKGWTAEKRRLASKLFGETIIQVAFRLNVPANELLSFALHGEVPPAARDTGFADTVVPGSTPALSPPEAKPSREFRQRRKWTEDRLALLREHAGTMPVTDLAALLEVSVGALKDAARENGIAIRTRRALVPTPEQSARLREAAGKVEGVALAQEFGVQIWTLRKWARDLGLNLTVITWTEERRGELARLAGTMPMAELASQLGVSLQALKTEASARGLSLRFGGPERHDWTAERLEQLRNLGGTIPAAELAALLGVTLIALKKQAHTHKVSLRYRAPKASRPPRERPARPPRAAAEKMVALRRAQPRPGPTVTLPAPSSAPVRLASSRLEPTIVRRATPTSGWVRLRHPDGKWLRGDGLGWVDEKAHSYICKSHQVEAAKRAFPLAEQCMAVAEPTWQPRDKTGREML